MEFEFTAEFEENGSKGYCGVYKEGSNLSCRNKNMINDHDLAYVILIETEESLTEPLARDQWSKLVAMLLRIVPHA